MSHQRFSSKMFNFKTGRNDKRGRDPMFKCSVCGKFVSYDRRRVNVSYYTNAIFDVYQEQWYPEEETEFTHKKCEKKK